MSQTTLHAESWIVIEYSTALCL